VCVVCVCSYMCAYAVYYHTLDTERAGQGSETTNVKW
jgi:hypothetical protein